MKQLHSLVSLHYSCPGRAESSLLQLSPAGSVDNLIVLVISFGFVGKKLAELSEESLPVAGNVLHPQVLEDEFLTPVGRGEEQRVRLTQV